jgi:hypothetical protein
MTLAESLITVCADSAETLRPCDAGRLFEMAIEDECLKQVKDILRAKNVKAFEAFEQAESDHFTAIYQAELGELP